MVARKELSNEQFLRKHVKKLGGVTVKLTAFVGICDDLVLLPSGRAIFLELKRPIGGRLSPMQKWWLKKFRELGFIAEFAATKEQIKEILDGG